MSSPWVQTLSGDDVKELISKSKIKSNNKNSDDTTSNKKTSIPLGKKREKKKKKELGLNQPRYNNKAGLISSKLNTIKTTFTTQFEDGHLLLKKKAVLIQIYFLIK